MLRMGRDGQGGAGMGRDAVLKVGRDVQGWARMQCPGWAGMGRTQAQPWPVMRRDPG